MASFAPETPAASNAINPLDRPNDNPFSVSGQNGIDNLATYGDVKIKMDTPDYSNRLGVYDAGDLDAYQHLNPALFQIISTGINSIVKQLKLKLGDSFLENNESAKDIMKLLDDLSNTITTEDNKLDKTIVNRDLDAQTINIDNIDPDDAHMINNLDSWNNTTSNGSIFNEGDANLIMQKDTPLQLRNTDFDTNNKLLPNSPLMVRLRNCQNLEFLYLKKHDEILKIFAFTINLFDKYKYAVKVMLYLLKNLVDKDYIINEFGERVETERDPTIIEVPGENIYPTVTLPAKIITNMKKLLTDQKTIQGVIDKMDNTLKNNTTKLSRFDKNLDPKDVINTELGQGAPVGAPVVP